MDIVIDEFGANESLAKFLGVQSLTFPGSKSIPPPQTIPVTVAAPAPAATVPVRPTDTVPPVNETAAATAAKKAADEYKKKLKSQRKIDNLVILVGLPKSGTTSLHFGLTELGVKSAHYEVSE